jgi:hypothetical protein
VTSRPLRQCLARAAVIMTMGVAAGTVPSRADAADARFERLVLLPSPDRVSLVFEMTGEPREVSTRRISSAVMELEAGPIAAPVAAASFVAPTGVRFVGGVTIVRAAAPEGGAYLRARITLLETSRSAVRVVGRRVYVDFSADAPLRVRQPASPLPRRVPSAPSAPAAPDLTPPSDTYQTAVAPAIARLEELAPFLVSAANSPSAPVLKALSDTLTTISQSVGLVEVPEGSRRAHGLLSSAIAVATGAVDPSFGGDRASQARQALTLLNQAKAAL